MKVYGRGETNIVDIDQRSDFSFQMYKHIYAYIN